MKSIFLALLLGLAFLFAACESGPTITYDNQTRHRLCVKVSQAGPPSNTNSCADVPPNEKQEYFSTICSGDDLVWISITVGLSGQEIYGPRLATCEEWDGSTVTIQQRVDEFVVSDNLPMPIASRYFQTDPPP